MHHASIGFLEPEQPAGAPDQQAGSCTQSDYDLPTQRTEPRALVPIPPTYGKVLRVAGMDDDSGVVAAMAQGQGAPRAAGAGSAGASGYGWLTFNRTAVPQGDPRSTANKVLSLCR
jgi:hypothetical protein